MWCQFGFEPDAYWRQTPRTLDLALRGKVVAQEQERRGRTLQAYQIGELAGVRSKMPRAADWMRRWEPRQAKRRQSAAEIRAVMDQWRQVTTAVSSARKRKSNG